MNLDLEAAKIAQEIITEASKKTIPIKEGNRLIKKSELENIITKTLGVLQENGVYACMLYLYSRTSDVDKEIGKLIIVKLFNMIELLGKKPVNGNKAEIVLEYLINNICNDLNMLFLTKQLWEQTLIYARYGAKARS